MDSVVRRRRPFLIGSAAGLLLVACFGRGAGDRPAIGESDKAPGGRNPGDGGAGGMIDGAAALPSEYKTKFTKVNHQRMVSQGHATGRWEVDIYANEAAQKALAEKSHAVPIGAIVVEEHFERSGDRGKGPVMVMEKRSPGFSKDHGDWRWAVVGSQGQLVQDGTIDSCAGCHDDAPMDGLFPIVE
jgi:hypothetical protein